jgi:hypothetical protein
MLESIARRSAPDALSLEPQPAVFEGSGLRVSGEAEATVSRSSIAIRFRRNGELAIPKAAYGESNGTVTASRDGWFSAEVNDAGKATNGDQLFGTRAIRIGRAITGDEVAATRLITAGDAWNGGGTIGNRRFVIAPLSVDAVSHHDRRLAIALEGALDEATIETIGRACAFVAGIDVEILRVERYDSDGMLLDVDHRRGFRRVGRGAHSPFTGVAPEDKTRAWSALVEAFPRLLAEGFPIDMMIDQLSAHNQVSQIHVSAVLLLLTTQTAAYQRLHGASLGSASTPRRAELEKLSKDLGLGLTDEEIERFEKLRIELLDSGFFHAPGYETGRPQKDIKFLRDLAHVTVLRLCGYSGPFYGAERFVVRELASSLS